MKAKPLFLAVGVLLALGATSSDARHFALTRSAPTPDATVPSPAEVRLWFTEAAQDNSVGIRLIDTGGAALETGEPTKDPNDARVFSIALGRTLAAGRYTVAWRGIGDDGHVVQGDFAFTVSAE